MVEAAAIGIPAFDGQASRDNQEAAWLANVAEPRRADIIRRLLVDDPITLKAELLSEIRNSQQAPDWPVQPPTRTIAELLQQSEIQREKEDAKQRRLAEAKLNVQLKRRKSSGKRE